MTSRTHQHSERQEQIGNMPAPLSALQLRRQDAVQRSLAGDPIEAICRELGCSESWLYTSIPSPKMEMKNRAAEHRLEMKQGS